jgi:hypothetical protein
VLTQCLQPPVDAPHFCPMRPVLARGRRGYYLGHAIQRFPDPFAILAKKPGLELNSRMLAPAVGIGTTSWVPPHFLRDLNRPGFPGGSTS